MTNLEFDRRYLCLIDALMDRKIIYPIKLFTRLHSQNFGKLRTKIKMLFSRKSNAMPKSMSRKQTEGMNTWKVKKSNTFGMTIAHFAGKKH